MTKAMEDALWIRGKQKPITEYLRNAKAVENVVAGAGFLYRPGFLGATITGEELNLKLNLSEVNYQILKQAIERELVETGHDYDIAYKEAIIDWELEKMTTLTDLEQEFADNKRIREFEKQDLDRLEITTNLRKLIIIAAKASIEEDMEELKQQAIEIDRLTWPKEDELISAKLLTAQKKLDVIPYIETVLDKQQDLVNELTANADRKQALITEKELLNDNRVELISAREAIVDAIILLLAAKQSVLEKKEDLVAADTLVVNQQETNASYLNQYISSLTGLNDIRQNLITAKKALIPYIREKATAMITYASELDAWIAVKNSIAAVKEQIADVRELKAERKADITTAKSNLVSAQLNLREAEINLAIAKLTGKTSLFTQQIENTAEMLSKRESELTKQLNRKIREFDTEQDYNLWKADEEYDNMVEINDYVFDKEEDYIKGVALAQINEQGEIAAISVNTKLTSQLTHLLT